MVKFKEEHETLACDGANEKFRELKITAVQRQVFGQSEKLVADSWPRWETQTTAENQ